jgi:drug/metabolite transporter (DMT)-like permease
MITITNWIAAITTKITNFYDNEENQAPFLMLSAAGMYACQNFNVKLLSPYFDTWLILMVRSSTAFLISFLSCLYFDIRPLLGHQKKKLLLRGCLGGSSIVFGYLSIRYLPLSTASFLNATSPLWTAILCFFYRSSLDLVWTRKDTLGVFISLCGIVLLYFNDFQDFKNIRGRGDRKDLDYILGVVFGTLCSFSQALVTVTTRDIRDENTLVISTYSMGFTSITTVPFVLYLYFQSSTERTFFKNNRYYSILLCLTGILSLSGQTLKTMALQKSKNVGVVIMRYMEIVFACLIDRFVFHTILFPLDIVSILLVVLGVVVRSLPSLPSSPSLPIIVCGSKN